MIDLGTIIPAAGLGGAFTWAGTFTMQWMKSRGDRRTAQSDAAVKLEQHNDKFALELLNAARTEMAAVKAEIADLRPLQARIAHLDEALDHISALLSSDRPEERKAAERRARAFLNRMRRLADARGTLLNEVQRQASAAGLPPELQQPIDRLDEID